MFHYRDIKKKKKNRTRTLVIEIILEFQSDFIGFDPGSFYSYAKTLRTAKSIVGVLYLCARINVQIGNFCFRFLLFNYCTAIPFLPRISRSLPTKTLFQLTLVPNDFQSKLIIGGSFPTGDFRTAGRRCRLEYPNYTLSRSTIISDI